MKISNKANRNSLLVIFNELLSLKSGGVMEPSGTMSMQQITYVSEGYKPIIHNRGKLSCHKSVHKKIIKDKAYSYPQ